MKIPRPVLYVIAGVLALVVVVVIVLSWGSGDEPAPSPVPTNSAPSDGGGDAPSDGDEGVEIDPGLLNDGNEYAGPDEGLPEGSESDRTESAAVAMAAVGVWVDHDLTTDEWSKAMKSHVSPEAWNALNLPAPHRVSATEITGEIQDGPDGVTTQTAEYVIPTDAGDLTVALVKQGDDWKVSYIDKEL